MLRRNTTKRFKQALPCEALPRFQHDLGADLESRLPPSRHHRARRLGRIRSIARKRIEGEHGNRSEEKGTEPAVHSSQPVTQNRNDRRSHLDVPVHDVKAVEMAHGGEGVPQVPRRRRQRQAALVLLLRQQLNSPRNEPRTNGGPSGRRVRRREERGEGGQKWRTKKKGCIRISQAPNVRSTHWDGQTQIGWRKWRILQRK